MFKTIYHFQVNELLIKGEKVYCLNMEKNKVCCLNKLMVNCYFGLMDDAKKDDGK